MQNLCLKFTVFFDRRVSFFWFVFFLCIATKKENEQEQFLIALKYFFIFYFFYRILSNALFISFLFLRLKRKETNQRKEKERWLKRAFKALKRKFHLTRRRKFSFHCLKISNKQTSPSGAYCPRTPCFEEILVVFARAAPCLVFILGSAAPSLVCFNLEG